MLARQMAETRAWNQTGLLWEQKRRGTVRVVMVITMDTTALLLFWALLELVCKQDRRREGLMFVLKVFYINSVMIAIIFFNVSLFLHPLHSSCAAVVGLTYVSSMCSLSWTLLSAVQKFLLTRQAGPEQLHSQILALSLTVLYMMVGYGVPCVGLVTLTAHFSGKTFVAQTMCWLSSQAIWWMVVPITFFVGGTYTVALVALRQFTNTPADVRCFLYTCFLLACLLSCSLLMLQVDVTWPSISKAYIALLLIILHNVLVWFHLTDAFQEIQTRALAAGQGRRKP